MPRAVREVETEVGEFILALDVSITRVMDIYYQPVSIPYPLLIYVRTFFSYMESIPSGLKSATKSSLQAQGTWPTEVRVTAGGFSMCPQQGYQSS